MPTSAPRALAALLACGLLSRIDGAQPPMYRRVAAGASTPPSLTGGTGGTKRLLAKARTTLLSPPPSAIVVDGTNLRGHHGFRLSEAELLAQVRGWVRAERGSRGRVLVCFDGGGAGGGTGVCGLVEGGAVAIVRSGSGDSADDLISRAVTWLRAEIPSEQAVVVSADRGLLFRCSGARAVHPTAFASLLRQHAAPKEATDSALPGLIGPDSELLASLVQALAPSVATSLQDQAETWALAQPKLAPKSVTESVTESVTDSETDGEADAVADRVRYAPRASTQMRMSGEAKVDRVSEGWDLLKAKSALSSGSVSILLFMFVCGALLGPWLDGFHGAFGVLKYKPPLALELPVGVFAAGDVSRGLLRTAAWVPPLFGVAGALIGGLYVGGDAARPGGAEKPAPTLPAVFAAIGCFTLQYWLSGALWASGERGPLVSI